MPQLFICMAERFAPFVGQEITKEEFDDYQLLEDTEIDIASTVAINVNTRFLHYMLINIELIKNSCHRWLWSCFRLIYAFVGTLTVLFILNPCFISRKLSPMAVVLFSVNLRLFWHSYGSPENRPRKRRGKVRNTHLRPMILQRPYFVYISEWLLSWYRS